MRNDYSREIELLAEMDSHLKERCMKLPSICDDSQFGSLLSLTVDGMKNIEEALQKLLKAREGVEKLIEYYQVYMEAELKLSD